MQGGHYAADKLPQVLAYLSRVAPRYVLGQAPGLYSQQIYILRYPS